MPWGFLRLFGIRKGIIMSTDSVPNQRLSADFWKFWFGQTISNLGSSITLFVLPLLVFKLTGSALDLGISTGSTASG
jgi:hypothetical protein